MKPERIVPLHFVREVGGRLNFRGEELRPLDEASARDAARFFRGHGVHTVGICLLHSYANPVHERRVSRGVSLRRSPIPRPRIHIQACADP
jgi:N-methylhydantoinase A